MPLVECVPNFSEGRRKEVVDKIVEEIQKGGKVTLLDSRMDPDHNRAVVTFIGEPQECFKAAFAGCKKAAELIDMDQHTGEHNRFGATDVIPFIPISDITIEECAELADKLAKKIGEELNIPTYLYGAAAKRPEREVLQKYRTKSFQYEQLKEEIATNPLYEPDYGPKEVPKAGATNVGAREFLIAYNVYLDTNDYEIAAKISRAIRFSGGGLRYIQAGPMEIKERNCVQVSMNITNYKGTPIHRVLEMIKREAAQYGVNVTETEVYGMIPLDALLDAAIHYLQLHNFDKQQIIEKRIE
ncbi:MAG: glutamate formimidoyltransferase [Candidatus Heimdallarchaeum aukensis]|uniref:glutamate formimidoyltransferase n=1 Tax=Candidatus Heimdallarchaeum aukensis TaxID=2876573 RepID=A0A9Y1BLY9_9ARCH|nr:MAG: glutamate formimidoyltransferase [Candidatus Heimdallarchaeum aukensis]